MSNPIRPQATITKKTVQQKVQDLGIKWSDDPQKNLKQLQRLTKELETNLSVTKANIDWGTTKKYKEEDIRDARKWFREEIKRLINNP